MGAPSKRCAHVRLGDATHRSATAAEDAEQSEAAEQCGGGFGDHTVLGIGEGALV